MRDWWAEQHAALLDVGIAGIWNDMNEPAGWTRDLRIGKAILPLGTPDTEELCQADPPQGPFDGFIFPEGSIDVTQVARFLIVVRAEAGLLCAAEMWGRSRGIKDRNTTPPGVAERPAAADRLLGGTSRREGAS